MNISLPIQQLIIHVYIDVSEFKRFVFYLTKCMYPLNQINHKTNRTSYISQHLAKVKSLKFLPNVQSIFLYRKHEIKYLPSSLNINSCWYSFKNWVDLDSSKKSEYTRLMSSTSTSVPWKTHSNLYHNMLKIQTLTTKNRWI